MAVDAGSDLFLTNSFGGNSAPFEIARCGAIRARELSRLSVELGREIADAADRPVVVAASVGPTGEIFGTRGQLVTCRLRRNLFGSGDWAERRWRRCPVARNHFITRRIPRCGRGIFARGFAMGWHDEL